MEATIVIPVWHGEQVILDCLKAVFAHSGEQLLEVICVDNASHDASTTLIRDNFPQVTVLSQPVNLGFAGGVNTGLRAATGDLLILLNQDCMVQSGWLDALIEAAAANPALGIVGAHVLNADGSVNHAGAYLERPLAYGRHITNDDKTVPTSVEYVTGAVFGITRAALDRVGWFDEGFYPAYFEEADYCFRAKRQGFEIGYVPGATAVHLFSGDEWQTSPVRHNANQHAMRYRFVSKHYTPNELDAFFQAEADAVGTEQYYMQAIGRLLGVRQTLQTMPDILNKREQDLDSPLTPAGQRQLSVGFTHILHQAFAAAEKITLLRRPEPPTHLDQSWQEVQNRLQVLQQQEHDLLTRIYFKPPGSDTDEPTWKRFYRLLVLRPLSFLIGRDYLLLAQLNTIHVARFDQMAKMQRLIERRLTLLETLTHYEFR